MDLHIVPGVSAKMAAEAHREDHKVQNEFGCRCMTYWVDEERGRAFCLIEAPNKEAINKMHTKAYGAKPLEIIEVNSSAVEAFLGRIHDPETIVDLSNPDLKIFNDPAFRIILVIQMIDEKLLEFQVGKEKSKELLFLFKNVVRSQIKKYGGNEAISKGVSIISSFGSSFQAVKCASAIKDELQKESKIINLHLGLHAGNPVTKDGSLFSDVVKFGKFLCSIGNENEIILSPITFDLYKKEYQRIVEPESFRYIDAEDEKFLESLMNTLSENWNDTAFNVVQLSNKMILSKSRLYRTCISRLGKSPNSIILEYRLKKSLQLLIRKNTNVAQTAFDAGFSSASYFTKCFRKHFGLQPSTYRLG
ncbi:nickel-binding protein [Flaviramulus basaltis]|nr:nickel-binding protein [Flaviramulus basaltis]